MLRNCVVALLVLAAMAPLPGFAADASKREYEVHHSRFGNIGTYSNSVETNGTAIKVATEAHILVSFAGFTLFRQDAAREERWDAGRLVFFRGMTTTNGRSIALNGAAEGDSFIINSPQGEIVAPAAVRIANPWSPDVLRGATLFTPDRGRLENVRSTEGEEDSLTIEGRKISTKRYEIIRDDGEKRYEIWMDGEGTPVQFVLYNRYGTVTFTLAN